MDDAWRARQAACERLVNELRAALATDPLFSPLPELLLERTRTLGEGGMGVVHLVQDRRLGRPAALKLVKTDGSATRIQRFLREVQITARLDHPGIPPVYDAGRTSSGQHFMLLRFVDGQSLEARMKAGTPLRELLGILVKVGEAVSYAHARRVVHRDLKPANVMVGAFGEVLVMDWGLARDLAESRSADEKVVGGLDSRAFAGPDRGLTQADAILGTLGYLPPEQARNEDVDERADVFALGAILTEMVSGKLPVSGISRLDLLTATVDGKIATPRELSPDAPPELDAIAARALAQDREDRYPRVADMVEDVRAYLEGRPVSVHRYSALAQAGHVVRRNPTLFATLGAVLVVSLAAATALALQNVEIRRNRDAVVEKSAELERALAKLEKETRERQVAEKRRQAVEGSLSRIAEARSRFRSGAPAAEVERAVDEALALDRSEGALLEAARVLSDVGRDDAAANLLRAAADEYPPGYTALFALHELEAARTGEGLIARTQALTELAERARQRHEQNEVTLLMDAISGLRRDDLDAALASADAALERAPRLFDGFAVRCEIRVRRRDLTGALSDAERAIGLAASNGRGYHQRALVLSNLGKPTEAIADYDRALDLSGSNRLKANILVNRASARRELKDHEGARRDLDRAIELWPEFPRAWFGRSSLRHSRGDLAGARADAERAVALDGKSGLAWADLSVAAGDLGDRTTALEAARRATEVEPRLAAAWEQLGFVLSRLASDDAGALAALDRALGIAPSAVAFGLRCEVKRSLGDLPGSLRDGDEAVARSPRLADLRSSRALTRERLGDVAGARADYDQAIADEPDFASAWVSRGALRANTGDPEGALADLDRAVALAPKLALAWSNRGLVQIRRGELDAALADLDKACALDPSAANRLDRAQGRVLVGDFAGARAEAEEVLAKDPRAPRAYALRGLARSLGGDTAGGLADLDRALELAPSEGTVLELHLFVRIERGDLEGAASEAAASVARFPKHAYLLEDRGRLALLRHDPAAALADLDASVALEPHGSVFVWRAEARLARGDRPGAIADLEQAVRLLPTRHFRRKPAEARLAELRAGKS